MAKRELPELESSKNCFQTSEEVQSAVLRNYSADRKSSLLTQQSLGKKKEKLCG